MFEDLKLSFGLSETEMFSVPAPMPRLDAAAPTVDWPARPYRPFWAGLRGRLENAGAKALDGLLIDRPDEKRRALARSLQQKGRRWGTTHQLQSLALSPRNSSENFKFVVVGDAEPGRFALWR